MTSWRNIFSAAVVAALCVWIGAAASAQNTISNYAIRGDGTGSAYGLLTEVEVVTAGVGAPLVLTAADCGKTFTTDGITATAYVTLPTASAGLWVRFVDDDASDLLRVTCASGDTLSINESVSSAAGYAQSGSAAGESSMTLMAVDNTRWIAIAIRNGWDVFDGALNAATGLRGAYYFSSPAATTVTQDTPIKAGGTTTAVALRGFTHANNRLTYDGAATKDFLVTVAITVDRAGGGGSLIGRFMLYKDGSLITGARIDREMADTTDEGALAISWIAVDVATDAYFEIWLDSSVTDDITISHGGLTMSSVSSN